MRVVDDCVVIGVLANHDREWTSMLKERRKTEEYQEERAKHIFIWF
jgi:hypothetical protein